MRMGPTDADCTTACISSHGASYALNDGESVYVLTGDRALEPFAGQRARVIGTLDAETQTIRVDSIAAAE
jgi:hypothetical protein